MTDKKFTLVEAQDQINVILNNVKNGTYIAEYAIALLNELAVSTPNANIKVPTLAELLVIAPVDEPTYESSEDPYPEEEYESSYASSFEG